MRCAVLLILAGQTILAFLLPTNVLVLSLGALVAVRLTRGGLKLSQTTIVTRRTVANCVLELARRARLTLRVERRRRLTGSTVAQRALLDSDALTIRERARCD